MNERRNGAAKSASRDKRVLIYSHDSFGLGHLSRCRTIANSLVAQDKNLSVLILSGSPLIGSFDFRARVDFVRIPGVIKLRNGEYTSLNLLIDIEETLHMRASIIQHTADIFDPDLFLIDKEPLGLRGEVTDTLKMLKKRGTPLVLGLRDVMDEPTLLEPEWQRKKVVPALRDLYDDIWVYGLPQMCDPVAGINLPKSVRRKITYTGYLRRELPRNLPRPAMLSSVERPYILVTAGGGGDGEGLIDWVLRAYEQDKNIPYDAVIVFGPFMNPQRQKEFRRRVEAQPKVHALTFESNLAALMTDAAGVVAMGGYNTFCEILSFDKRALIVPRTQPRLEQYIRASAARALGMANMLPDDGQRDAQVMATALRQLPQQSLPSEVVIPGLLDGLPSVNRLVKRTLASRPHRPSPVETARKRA